VTLSIFNPIVLILYDEIASKHTMRHHLDVVGVGFLIILAFRPQALLEMRAALASNPPSTNMIRVSACFFVWQRGKKKRGGRRGGGLRLQAF